MVSGNDASAALVAATLTRAVHAGDTRLSTASAQGDADRVFETYRYLLGKLHQAAAADSSADVDALIESYRPRD